MQFLIIYKVLMYLIFQVSSLQIGKYRLVLSFGAKKLLKNSKRKHINFYLKILRLFLMNYQDEAEEVVVEYLPISPFPFLFFFFKHVSPFPFWLIAFLLRIDFVTLQIDNHIL